ncbi:uncharacterized protein ppp1r3ab [Silurus meridionalis]|uniref:CBM21 domain-containing protein n=1 Tax=Silurus meridionalis TaxID=175797 RepID=A0A8T0BQB0_SILME|nr:uncharacterized protein ppp1r3ab [Silurus meridionalis]XP_046704824.1 uncharacterized protein ppp1r3ab [Silurus meridionalis]KAF7707596.1 hypothetical protein HF521_018814 [Silurus meridionalis]
MEPVVGELQELNICSSNLLGLPEPCSLDSDDEQLDLGGIKPKSSPIPRRRSSLSCSDDDSQPPPSSSRRVSFADAFGLSLVSVKQFNTRSMCDPAESLEVEFKDSKEYYLKVLFALPLTLEELLYRVQEQKVDLESLELMPGTTTLKGSVRVLNLCFDKLVYIRTSLDCWSSHFDLLAEYVSESSQGLTDCFSFKLTMVPPFGERGARVDFCIRYETPFGTFWANNGGQNYVVFCHEKAKEQDENEKLVPKSCLKPSRNSSMTSTTSNAEEIPEIILNCGIAAVTEPVGVKEEQTQEEHTQLKEENSRNNSRRSRRKAARMAKLQQYFAKRDEKDLQQTENDNDKVDVPVPVIDESPLNLSTPETNVASLPAEPRTSEGQRSINTIQVPAPQTQAQEKDNIKVTHPEPITSKFQPSPPSLDSESSHISVVDLQLLESSQDKETSTSQDGSFKCQMSDNSIGETVEKAWECFEKCALEKKESTEDTDSRNQMDNTLLEDKQGIQSFGCHYTFETIVAPLYHQVFERMENDRRGVKNRTSKADKSVRKQDDGSLRIVTYPVVETRSNPEISAKHVSDDAKCHGACKETFPEYLHNTQRATENALSLLNEKTKLVAEIALQDSALPDITDNLLDASISESKTEQAFIPTEEQHLLNSQPLASSKDSTFCREQTPEYIKYNKPPCSEYSQSTLQQELVCIDNAILPIESEVDFITTNPPPTIVSKQQSEEILVTQTSIETQISEEIDKIHDEEPQTSEQTLNTCISCLEKSNTPMPGPTVFHSDISSNVTPKIIQSNASGPSQNLTHGTIKSQIPAPIFFTQNLEATEDIKLQIQSADDINLIRKKTLCQNNDRFNHAGSETQSNLSNRNDGVDHLEEIEKGSETIRTQILHKSPEETSADRILENLVGMSQINENKSSHLNFPDELPDFNGILNKNMEVPNISSNPDNLEDTLQGEEEEFKENDQVKNPNKMEEQELTAVTEIQLEEVKEISEVEKPLEVKDPQKEGKHENQVEKKEQEIGKKAELDSKEKIKDGSYSTEDGEEDTQEDGKEKDAEPRRNRVEDQEDLAKHLAAEIEKQEMVDGVTSMVRTQSILNIDSLISEVHLHVGHKQQNTGLEQMSEEAVSERRSTCEKEDIFRDTDSSQQALLLNSDAAFNEQDKEEDVCCQIDKTGGTEDTTGKVAVLKEQEKDSLNKQSENMDDGASTESLTDDEMELYLLRLKNTQQTGLKDSISMGKRHSISRTWTIASPMPSILENMDEDQPHALMDELTNEQTVELERATRPLLDKDVIQPNVLWWRELFSFDNMPNIIVYTLLFVVFLITAYICDFIACFTLYLLALYWLYFQVQREPIKGT